MIIIRVNHNLFVFICWSFCVLLIIPMCTATCPVEVGTCRFVCLIMCCFSHQAVYMLRYTIIVFVLLIVHCVYSVLNKVHYNNLLYYYGWQ